MLISGWGNKGCYSDYSTQIYVSLRNDFVDMGRDFLRTTAWFYSGHKLGHQLFKSKSFVESSEVSCLCIIIYFHLKINWMNLI